MSIGEKIKKKRKILGLTQSDVAGDKISRNMLSLIENGVASPSLETLQYLSKKLDIRIEYLVSDDISFEVFERMDHEEEIVDAFQQNQYEKVVELVDKYGQNSKILIHFAVESAYMLALEKIRGGSLESAKKWIEITQRLMDKSPHDTRIIRARLMILSTIAQNIQSPKLNFKQENYESIMAQATENEYYRYYLGDLDYPYTSEIISLHTNAKKLIKARKFQEAIALLTTAEEKKTLENYDAYTFFGIYTDLENCYKELLDFEKAYRYALKKMSMMEYFKS